MGRFVLVHVVTGDGEAVLATNMPRYVLDWGCRDCGGVVVVQYTATYAAASFWFALRQREAGGGIDKGRAAI